MSVTEDTYRNAVDDAMVRVVDRLESSHVAPLYSFDERGRIIDHLDSLRFAMVPSSFNGGPATLDCFALGPAKRAEMEELLARLRTARSVFTLTGSGISAESGLPTFRGVGGLWRSHRVEELASPAGFARDPVLVWTWYNERLAAHRRASPNPGHYALARLEQITRGFSLATQNVDSLHLRAGSSNLIELHGNLREARCDRCGERRPLDAAGMPIDEIDHTCGGRMRPDIVWFGEALPRTAWERAEAAAARADVILVVGTSAVVYPAAALATHYNRSAFVAEINPEQTAISENVDLTIRASAAEALPALLKQL